jgi:protein TonB
VGGNVQAANLIRQVRPNYPPLAKQARIQGVVRFNAIISRDGTIQNLQMVSGHPLLVPAATDAVRQWVYKPTLLNGEAVEVQTQIDVNFTLSN